MAGPSPTLAGQLASVLLGQRQDGRSSLATNFLVSYRVNLAC